MPAYLQYISTLVPEFAYPQAAARDLVTTWTSHPRTQRIIHALYDRSGINTRYSVCGDFVPGREPNLFKPGPDGIPLSPGTGERNALYATASRDLAVRLARQLLQEAAADFAPEDITHIIFTSCTGFANPGPDFHIIRELGLSGQTQRYTLGFMGCYAAFPTMRMAAQFCEADPEAVVLIMCLELCSLHLQFNDQPDFILANSLFADGAAAAIVSSKTPRAGSSGYRFNGFSTSLLPTGERDMAWDIGNHGFNLVLSSYVPDVIATNVRSLIEETLTQEGLSLASIDSWAVHPGGRAILDRVQDSLALGPNALQASRKVLRDYGNMSSATVLFVLKELLASGPPRRDMTCALAFGPGLTVETAVLERLPQGTLSGQPVDLSLCTAGEATPSSTLVPEPIGCGA